MFDRWTERNGTLRGVPFCLVASCGVARERAIFFCKTSSNGDTLFGWRAAPSACALEAARPYLAPAQAAELTTRFDWLRQFAQCNGTLDVSLWRFRYLRAKASPLSPSEPPPPVEAKGKA